MTKKPRRNPHAGEVTIGTTTFQSKPLPSHQWSGDGMDQIITDQSHRAAASAPPQRPPIRAWLELEGIPNHHVIRFQIIPPSSAHTRTSEVTIFVSTSPEAIVLATA